MKEAIPNDPLIEASDAGSNDPTITLDDSSAPPKRRRRRFLSKLVRSAAVAAGEEVVASWLAHDRGKYGSYITYRVPKMAVYGAFVETSLTYFLLKKLRSLGRGLEATTARVLEILVGMLIIAPIQQISHILSMALIAGARTSLQFKATVRASLLPAMKVIWFATPVAVAFAQNCLPKTVWPQFFGLVSFIINTYCNAHLKKMRLAALRKKHMRLAQESTLMKSSGNTSQPEKTNQPKPQ